MSTSSDRVPWRYPDAHVKPVLMAGRGSVLGPDTNRRTRWWEIRLTCGHLVERTVSYRRRSVREQALGARARTQDDVLPPPRRVRCEFCEGELRRGERT